MTQGIHPFLTTSLLDMCIHFPALFMADDLTFTHSKGILALNMLLLLPLVNNILKVANSGINNL